MLALFLSFFLSFCSPIPTYTHLGHRPSGTNEALTSNAFAKIFYIWFPFIELIHLKSFPNSNLEKKSCDRFNRNGNERNENEKYFWCNDANTRLVFNQTKPKSLYGGYIEVIDRVSLKLWQLWHRLSDEQGRIPGYPSHVRDCGWALGRDHYWCHLIISAGAMRSKTEKT